MYSTVDHFVSAMGIQQVKNKPERKKIYSKVHIENIVFWFWIFIEFWI